jgi:cell division septation protein DedD
MGRKSAQNATAAPDTATTEPPLFTSPKPDAGSQAPAPTTQPAAETDGAAPASPAPEQAATAAPASTVTVPLTPPKNAATPADGMIAGDKPSQPATSNLQPATFMVQVAAVSSQDVADILLASLQKKGYSVAVHHEPQDSLLHVQIGPFAKRADAEAMRQRVLADGFNAIVK